MELKKLIKICGSIAAAVFIICTAFIIWMLYNKNQFEPPEFEPNVIFGMPDFTEEEKSQYGYFPLNVSEEICVYVCGAPNVSSDKIDVYITNIESNDLWIMGEVFTSEGQSAGKTGIIKQGFYVQSLNTSISLLEKETASIKIYFFEPETYYSAGQTVTLNIDVKK